MQRFGHVRFEFAIMAFVAVIGAAFPSSRSSFRTPIPWCRTACSFQGSESSAVYVAVAMVGATVMPHVVYLHSGLVQHRADILDGKSKREHFRHELIDIALAMDGALLINASMVTMAAAVFFHVGADISGIEDGSRPLGPLLGPLAPAAFGIALLASGLSSSTVGTLAGQMIVDGFMNWRVRSSSARLITMIPALM